MAADTRESAKGPQAPDGALGRLHEVLVADEDSNSRLLGRFLQSVKDGKYDQLMLPELTASNLRQTSDPDLSTPGSVTTHHATAPAESLDSARDVGSLDAKSLQADHAELSRKYNALSANFKIAKAALRKRVEERDGWASHAKYLQFLISAAEKKHGINILDPRTKPPRAPTPTTVGVDASGSSPRAHASSEKPLEGPASSLELGIDTSAAGPEQAVPSDQLESTQGDTEDSSAEQLPRLPPTQHESRFPIKQEPSSDEPVLVTERVVRKRKRGDSIPASRRPKTEPADSSSPILARISLAGGAQEDIDLGEIEQRLVTPRKQKDLKKLEPAHRAATPRPQTSSAARPTTAARPEAPRQAALGGRSPALTPLSVNVQKRAWGGSKPGLRPVKQGLAFALSALAEDGDIYGTTQSIPKDLGLAVTPTSAKSRLQELLNGSSAAPSDSVSPRSVSRKREAQAASGHQPPMPERRRLPFGNDIAESPQVRAGPSRRTAPPTNDGRARPRSPRARAKKPASTIRTKPLSELQLDDFKINPSANDGHDFAFADVVRDKGERACLPGCTDLHCCGKQFRALALSQRPDPPLTPLQRMEEQKLLEEYLGDDAFRLASMSPGERAELWVEAKTQELANKYGKHRHRYSRMRSPPGFWNADFPSTQELEDDRAEAAKRERQVIAERYREAMRPGGRWLFKDE